MPGVKMPSGKVGLTVLIKQLKDRKVGKRVDAVEALIKRNNKNVVERLIPLLNSRSETVRRDVVLVLGNLGGKEALGALEGMLEDRSEFVRSNAAHFLKKAGKGK